MGVEEEIEATVGGEVEIEVEEETEMAGEAITKDHINLTTLIMAITATAHPNKSKPNRIQKTS